MEVLFYVYPSHNFLTLTEDSFKSSSVAVNMDSISLFLAFMMGFIVSHRFILLQFLSALIKYGGMYFITEYLNLKKILLLYGILLLKNNFFFS